MTTADRLTCMCATPRKGRFIPDICDRCHKVIPYAKRKAAK